MSTVGGMEIPGETAVKLVSGPPLPLKSIRVLENPNLPLSQSCLNVVQLMNLPLCAVARFLHLAMSFEIPSDFRIIPRPGFYGATSVPRGASFLSGKLFHFLSSPLTR